MPRPILYVAQILEWADSHHERTGEYPTQGSGPVLDAPGENWRNIDNCLRLGFRGLPGGSSLARLLQEERGVRNRKNLPPYTLQQIDEWVRAHREREGDWPHSDSGPIPEAPGETWMAVNVALRNGQRGMPGGSSLAQLLERRHGARNRMRLPRLMEAQILKWMDAEYRRSGMHPHTKSGPVKDAPGETWFAVDHALRAGARGLPGGSSLAKLLEEHRGVGRHVRKPPLSLPLILTWIDEHRQEHGAWPNLYSGPIRGAPGETWLIVDEALRKGKRGLPGGSSLAKVLAEYRGVRNIHSLPPLTEDQIRAWAAVWKRQHGRRPTRPSGPIPGTHGETWQAVDIALQKGHRSLPGGSSLAKLLEDMGDRSPR
ncbi:MAG TPA: hypothetical protein VML55_15175 [Planctomycetaceae bacterium]|nr:hypothetical protein [Planctomycetaceae bacterium]